MDGQATRRLSSGQTLALFALLLPVLLGFVAVGLDSANLMLAYRDAQSAADLAALAGARSLPAVPTPADQTAARDRAQSVAAANGFSSGVTATTPYIDAASVPHPSQIEVVITGNVRTYIMPIFGISSLPITVRAVAQSEWSASGGTLPAVFAGCSSTLGGTSCPDAAKALEWSGSNGVVVGGTVSNCSLLVPGSSNSFLGGAQYRTGCTYSNNGSGNVYEPPAAAGSRQDWPVTYAYTDFEPCTYTKAGKLELKFYYQSSTSTSKTLKPGVYCATGAGAEIVLDEFGVSGDVTLVSQEKVTISGSNFNLRAYHPSRVVIWAGGTGAPTVAMGGSNGSWTGIIYARVGQVEISGSDNTTGAGSILADRIKIGGQGVRIDANALDVLGSPSLIRLQLVE